jgi:hypothetical protein
MYLRTSILITTNLPFSDWTQVFQDERLLVYVVETYWTDWCRK